MIKRILVALDPDSDTPIAIRYASDIARHHGAEVVGLAVIDTGIIESETRGGGIGSMYYAEKLRENLTEDTRARAQELISAFESAVVGAGVIHSESVQEGVPFHRIVEDMKYHDLLVVGREPHFFYGRPEQKTQSLALVVKESSAPTLIVGETYRPVRRILIAYDGSDAAARTVHYFTYMQPFGIDLEVEAVHVYSKDREESELLLRLLASYMNPHGFHLKQTSLQGNNASSVITDYALASDADLVV
ncbi:MAG: universal stress protein, partial [Rhodothermales bacterium]